MHNEEQLITHGLSLMQDATPVAFEDKTGTLGFYQNHIFGSMHR